MTAAVRQRRARARRKAGLVPISLEIEENAIAEALIASGRLTEAESARRELVGRELAAVVADWAARWRGTE